LLEDCRSSTGEACGDSELAFFFLLKLLFLEDRESFTFSKGFSAISDAVGTNLLKTAERNEKKAYCSGSVLH